MLMVFLEMWYFEIELNEFGELQNVGSLFMVALKWLTGGF